ncbi:MAG: pyridoxamine 5'-phosphate oxidase [Calditrichaeota bacterium]|nr:pyridoxamine 5'-phosphate oxidase [Calditrichota bacterium]
MKTIKASEEYLLSSLTREDLSTDPFNQFDKWFKDALASDIKEPNAMTLATVNADNTPSARMVLLKDYSTRGFIFFTNYSSRKGRSLLLTNPYAALVFWWEPLQRQIRIEGIAHKLSSKLSNEYFNSRPRGSQLGAIASQQSQTLDAYETLENQYKELDQRFRNKTIERPDNWGGIVINPERFEFWQGRPNRLHDRFIYQRDDKKNWQIERLYP